MTILAGAKVVAADFDLPDPETAYGNGTNVITATSFTDLPTTSCIAAVTNPHPTANMLCMVTYGAWTTSATSSAQRLCPRVSGAVTIAAGIGGGGPIGWGEVIRTDTDDGYGTKSATVSYELPPGTSTFTLQAYREAASGTHQVNYATLRLVPLRYLF
ncbi:MAG: hypothetical protein PVJ28_00130 [Acidimicrobiia bacterium]|jgi:hypothetical protein